jgi:hypothetical protein
MSRVLFILKRREDYSAIVHSHIGLSTGLYNSASFVNDMLNNVGVDSKLIVVKDNNDIDREVTAFRPTHVIIEALWVVPTKFEILQKLHPKVKWIIRLHSETPFMAGEGMAMDWLGDYSRFKNIILACNAPRFLREVRLYLQHLNNWDKKTTDQKVIYLPNFYPQDYVKKSFNRNKDTIDIGCFGAVRPLKNHMVQIFAALDFAERIGKKLRFHINAGRIEMQGQPVLNNIRGFFQQIHGSGHELINHQWCPREDFLKICASMDIGLQVSFSETFNIVGADIISQGVPLVGSKEIPWAIPVFNADPTDSKNISNKLMMAYKFPRLNIWAHQISLKNYTDKTLDIWFDYFNTKD